MSGFVTVARLDALEENRLHSVEVEGRQVVLVRQAEAVYALEDRCSHEEFPLSEGEVTGNQVTCALHGARFELATGRPKALPAVLPVKTYECRVDGDEVQVKLDES